MGLGFWIFSGKVAQKPDLKRLRVFGVRGYAHVAGESRRKLDKTGVPVRFLGYVEDSVGYIVQREDNGRIFNTATFFCDETSFTAKQPKIDQCLFDQLSDEVTDGFEFDPVDVTNTGVVTLVNVEGDEEEIAWEITENTGSMVDLQREAEEVSGTEGVGQITTEEKRSRSDISTDNILPTKLRSGALVFKALAKCLFNYKVALGAREQREF
eukprot:snap_masked-scaffold_28-processed-gene-4.24-mRNA-1 protein AED:0.40 eAED:0.40 QI:0/0/0/0.5/1/1/2/0/210